MQFTLSSKHLDFFNERSYIEFEELFSLQEMEQLLHDLKETVQKKEKVLIENCTPQKVFLAGRDLHKEHPFIKKISLHKKLGKILSSLTRGKHLRLAYDQLFLTGEITAPIFDAPYSLQEISCFQPLTGAVLIRLSGTSNDSLLPQKIGNGLFFKPTLSFPWSSLTQDPNSAFFLIAYGPSNMRYILAKRDPHTHIYKKLGYVFGDKVSDETHPVIAY